MDEMQPMKKDRLDVAVFIQCLHNMVHDESNSKGIGFSPDGTMLEFRDHQFLSKQVLPKYFRHQQVASFVRQLNNYSFRAVQGFDTMRYFHQHFHRDTPEMYRLIERKANDKKPRPKCEQRLFLTLRAENKELRREIRTLRAEIEMTALTFDDL